MPYKPHQETGITFLTTLTPSGKPHKFLGDAPGTGKTVTVCGAINKTETHHGLIITLASELVKTHWRNHLEKWCGFDRRDIHIYTEGKQRLPKRGVRVASYELLRNEGLFEHLYDAKYEFIIIDEAHKLKAEDTRISKLVLGDRNKDHRLITQGYWKWCLSGSFVMNRPMEMFPVMSALAPECLGAYRKQHEFGVRYCGGYFDKNDTKWYYDGASNLDELRKQIEPFYLRREIDDVYDDIPEVIENDVYIDVGEMECDETNTPIATLRKAIGIAKLPVVAGYLKDQLQAAPNEKILTFTYSREVSEGLRKAFPKSGLVYGGTSKKQRTDAICSFMTPEGVNPLFMQLKSGGEALDGLQRICHNVVFAEVDYVPGGHDQQVGRLRRDGQNQPVNVVTVIAEGKYDERVLWTRRSKQTPIDRLFNNVERASRRMAPLISQYKLGEDLMSIEDSLQSIAESLKVIAEHTLAGVATGLKKAAEEPTGKNGSAKAAEKEEKSASAAKNSAGSAKDAAKTPKLTADDVRAAAADVFEALGENEETMLAIQAIVKKHGSKNGKADSLKPEKMALAIADIKALVEESGEGGESTEESGDNDLGI